MISFVYYVIIVLMVFCADEAASCGLIRGGRQNTILNKRKWGTKNGFKDI